MSNNTIKFYACNNSVTMHSKKSWWSGYNILWGHKNVSECNNGILVSHEDYENFLIWASWNAIEHDQTYQTDITRVKSLFGDYWKLSNFAVCNKRYCSP